MPIYGIYACELSYGGLHGMNNYGFFECDSDEEASELGRQLSFDVMSAYATISEGIREEAEEAAEERGLSEEFDPEEWDNFIDGYISDIEEENVEYWWVKLRADCPLSLKELKEREFNDFNELCELYKEDES